jgi:hypothetical protein
MYYTCFIGLSKYTAIISLRSINRANFVIETQCTFLETEIEFLNFQLHEFQRFNSSAGVYLQYSSYFKWYLIRRDK